MNKAVSDLLTKPEQQCHTAPRMAPVVGAMVQQLRIRTRLDLFPGEVATRSDLAGSETEAFRGAFSDVTRARFQVQPAVVGTLRKRDKRIKVAAEVLDWPTSGLALLVIEASLRFDMDPIAADENVGTLRQVGKALASGGIRPFPISLIVGRENKRND